MEGIASCLKDSGTGIRWTVDNARLGCKSAINGFAFGYVFLFAGTYRKESDMPHRERAQTVTVIRLFMIGFNSRVSRFTD